MASLITKNPWASAAPSPSYGGLEAQRADLWAIDLSSVVTGLSQYSGLGNSSAYTVPSAVSTQSVFASSVTLPEQLTTAKPYARLSGPVHYPDVDEALGQIRITFIVNVNTTGLNVSNMHALLEAWRSLVRAGRDPFDNEESFILSEASNYRYTYRFPVTITLYGGTSNAVTDSVSDSTTDGLVASATYSLVNLWCAGYQIGELNYRDGNQVHMITGVFYADTVLSGQSGEGQSAVTLSNSSTTIPVTESSTAITFSNSNPGVRTLDQFEADTSGDTTPVATGAPVLSLQTSNPPISTSFTGDTTTNVPDSDGGESTDPLDTPGQTAQDSGI